MWKEWSPDLGQLTDKTATTKDKPWVVSQKLAGAIFVGIIVLSLLGVVAARAAVILSPAATPLLLEETLYLITICVCK